MRTDPNDSQQAAEVDAVEPCDSGPEKDMTSGEAVNSLQKITGPALSPEDGNIMEQGSDDSNFPPGEQESEKPFLLVNNRRSGRKAANH